MISNHKLQEHQANLQNHSKNNYGGVTSKEQLLPRKKNKLAKKSYFPVRLHKLLQSSVSNPTLACLISWNEDGTCFRVHDKKAFEREIQPTYFNQSKYASFRRQLNLWSFQRLETHEREGFCFHPLFKRDEPHLCTHMRRSNIKRGKSRSAGLSSSSALHDSNTTKMNNKGESAARSSESTECRNRMKTINTVLTCTVVSRPTASKRENILETDPSLVKSKTFPCFPVTTTRDYAQLPAFQNKVSISRLG